MVRKWRVIKFFLHFALICFGQVKFLVCVKKKLPRKIAYVAYGAVTISVTRHWTALTVTLTECANRLITLNCNILSFFENLMETKSFGIAVTLSTPRFPFLVILIFCELSLNQNYFSHCHLGYTHAGDYISNGRNISKRSRHCIKKTMFQLCRNKVAYF